MIDPNLPDGCTQEYIDEHFPNTLGEWAWEQDENGEVTK